tara:strand:+ start:5401 stop:6102 length:702 start_codon:yes stop_codon:yes gene_type:complete
MSLISNVDKILSRKENINEIGYLKRSVSYGNDLSIVKGLDLKSILTEPAKNDSITTIKELKVVSSATSERTESELMLVEAVDKEPLDLFYRFLEAKGLTFPKSTFATYYNIAEEYMYALKYYFNRARPDQIAPYHGIEINVLHTETHHTPSYPSGHTMYSELAAHIASDEYPEHKEIFFKLSDYCGLARVLQGVHYPSDNQASKIAISKLYPKIKEKINEYQKSQVVPPDGRT